MHAKPCQAMPSHASHAKPSQAMPNHAKPCRAKSCQAKPCQAMPRQESIIIAVNVAKCDTPLYGQLWEPLLLFSGLASKTILCPELSYLIRLLACDGLISHSASFKQFFGQRYALLKPCTVKNLIEITINIYLCWVKYCKYLFMYP